MISGTAALFLAFVAAMAVVICTVFARRQSVRATIGLAAALTVWLVYVGTLSCIGVVADPALRPPGIVFIVVPVLLFVLFVVVRSAAAGRVARAIPIPLLIGLQSFRIGVELFLHTLWREGLVPKMLTFEGANVDLWIGVSAPLVAWIATRGRNGERITLVWSGLGLLSLANVVARSALTAPGPLNLLHTEIPNRAIGTFPYTFIAGFLAPLAVVLHVLALRALTTRRSRPGASSPALVEGSLA